MGTIVVTTRVDGKPDRVQVCRRIKAGGSDGVRVRVTMQDDQGTVREMDIEAHCYEGRMRGYFTIRDEHGTQIGRVRITETA